MKYRKNEAPDKAMVNLELNMGQVRMLAHMVDVQLSEIEEFGPNGEYITEKALQKLSDRLMTLTHTQLTPEEQKAAMDDWVKSYTHKDFIKVHGFDPYSVREVNP